LRPDSNKPFQTEAYDRIAYDEKRYLLCASRDSGGHYHGRVTTLLRQEAPDTSALYYLCGNGSMLDDAFDILVAGGVSPEKMHTELYF